MPSSPILPALIPELEAARPVYWKPDTLVFHRGVTAPDKLRKDMEAAGIPLIDKLGRPVGIHTFRGTFISHLQKRGVPTVFRYGFKAEGKGDPLILHHLGKYAARRKFRAVRCAHDCPENAAGPQVHLAPGRGRAVRRPPQRKPRGPRFKQTVAREINVPAKDEFAFVRQ